PHNKHVALDLACVDCHSTVETRSEASLPSVTKCMLCHAKLANDGPGVKLLIEYSERGREVPWRRVYSFTKEAHVVFRHASHVRAGVACETCHGNVAEMTVAERAVDHNMGTCLNCHRQSKASEDCAACHN
ncbi:MAG: menaquinol oxidoreductase, partial [bacterium]|nr:menaquinol oxidoreductase [bacterium]